VQCPACKTKLRAGQRFCGACGAKVDTSDDLTVTSAAETRRSGLVPAPGMEAAAASGWLTSSGSIDHGRFGPGTVIEERYRIIGLLGRGGMGEVYRADDLRLGQQIALKFLPEVLSADPRRLTQLHNEVRVARQVSHANVCRVYDVGDVDGQLFLTMEYVAGEDLAASLKRIGRFPEDRALELTRQICLGLAAAHERGIIHRDLKPANIMIDAEGRVRIMDFGLAAAGKVEEIRVGTPAYMAPEQLEGRDVSKQSDIYALGLVLYELFTGRRAFSAKSLAELVQLQTSGGITAPTEIIKGLDPAIERAIERCLEHDPERRPRSVLAVLGSLPGADPLAAALAAGETPSPEMVAAAGGDRATMTAKTAITWLSIAALLAIVVVVLMDKVSLAARVPLTKPPTVLADKAEELRQHFGYSDPVVDSAYGFIVNGEYLAWASKHGSAEAHWPQLAEGRPAPMEFWYRTSPRVMVPYNSGSPRTLFDPPFTGVTGMTMVRLDLQGRLMAFEAMPRQIDPAEQFPAATIDWLDILTKAGLDPAVFTEVTPGRTPRTFADARHAFRGPLGDSEITVTVETASYRGRPVYFEIIGPWTAASRDPGGDAGDDGNGPLQIILILTMLAVAAFLTHANLKKGRADRRGAFRLATFIACLLITTWVLAPHVQILASERSRFFTAVAFSLFLGGAMYLIYLAVEPFIRSSWPTTLMSWTRLLSGRIRDALVGRDLLIGISCGMAMSLLDQIDRILPVVLGWPERTPVFPGPLSALVGLRPFINAVLSQISSGVQNGLIGVLVIALSRAFVQRVMAWLKVTRVSADTVTATIAAVILVLLTLDSHAGNLSHIWAPLLTSGAALFIMLYLIFRVGVLALVFAYSTNFLMTNLPITFDSSRFYAGQGWFVLLLLLILAGLGFRWAGAADDARKSSSSL
jgi:serine/threonine-protein kinase